MKTKLIILVAAVGICIIGWRGYAFLGTSDDKGIKYYGNVETRTVTLGFRFLGQIKSIEKDEGMSVKKGEKLAELDNSNLLNSIQEINENIKTAEAELTKLKSGFRVEEIKEAKAQVEEAKASLAKITDNYERQKKLIESNATSEEIYQNAKASYNQAKAQLNRAEAVYELRKNGYRAEDIASQEGKLKALQAQAEKLKTDLRDYVITSPSDGAVLTRFKEQGSIASPGEGILEIAKNDEVWIKAYVDEINLGKIKPGQKMLIFTDSKKEPYTGSIGYIAPNAEFTPKNIQTEELRADLVYRFRVIVKNPDDSLRQGMPVTLKISKD